MVEWLVDDLNSLGSCHLGTVVVLWSKWLTVSMLLEKRAVTLKPNKRVQCT